MLDVDVYVADAERGSASKRTMASACETRDACRADANLLTGARGARSQWVGVIGYNKSALRARGLASGRHAPLLHQCLGGGARERDEDAEAAGGHGSRSTTRVQARCKSPHQQQTLSAWK